MAPGSTVTSHIINYYYVDAAFSTKWMPVPVQIVPNQCTYVRENKTDLLHASTTLISLFCSFLATGDSYLTLAERFRIGISTVSAIVIETCEAMWDQLHPIYLPTPKKDDWKRIQERFNKLAAGAYCTFLACCSMSQH